MFAVAAQPSNGRVDESARVGQRLRIARERLGLGLREVARRLDISASALSQIETGKSRPSVKTLYAITSELGLSMDELFVEGTSEQGSAEPAPRPPGQAAAVAPPSGAPGEPRQIVQRADARPSLDLDAGVTWERLTAAHDPDVDFLQTTYRPGSSSSGSEKLVRHNGREYGIVLSGELELTVGFESHTLGPGDACSFDSNEPHRLVNPGTEPATAIWCVVGRRGSDPRHPGFDST